MSEVRDSISDLAGLIPELESLGLETKLIELYVSAAIELNSSCPDLMASHIFRLVT